MSGSRPRLGTPTSRSARGPEPRTRPGSWGEASASVVYCLHMARTNINIDEKACTRVMRRYGFRTKREAVNFALRTVAPEPLGLEAARRLRGSGWEGDLDALRSDRVK